MATRADVEAFSQTTADLVAVAIRDLINFWAGIEPENAKAAAGAIRDFLPDLILVYGDVAATIAADHYEEMREQAGAPGLFEAILAAAVLADQVNDQASWAINDLFGDDANPTSALKKATQLVELLTMRPARDTIQGSAAADPAKPRFARVPTSPTPCAWCVMLAGRGAVYLSAETAGGFDEYHRDCGCVPTPTWDGQDLPDGYDPEPYFHMYSKAVFDLGGSTNLKKILAQMRLNEGLS